MLERGNFNSKLASVLVVAGSAVGLGNIWRFPYELGRNGGASLLVVDIICIVCFGLPLMVSEFAVGRHAQANTARAFGKMGGHKAWKYVGLWCVLTGTLILCYYGVVAGWALEYLVQAGLNGFANKSPEEFTADFNAFISHPFKPLLCMLIFMIINMLVIVAGVKKGVERASKYLMPLLFLFVVVLSVACLLLPNSGEGLKFLFQPKVENLTSNTLLSALGQAFYSLSLCMGCIATYASYFRREDKLVNNAVNSVLIDTLIALLAGIIIFTAAFSVGIEPGTGPSLVFITLPNVFQQVFGAQPWLCYGFSLMFYLLLFIATLTSAMGLLEVPTIYLAEEHKLSRRAAAIIATTFCVLVGVACSLSMPTFDAFDFFTAKIMLPIGGFFVALYTGWFCDKKSLENEVNHKIFPVYRFLLRYVVPLAIILIFLNQFGVL